MSVNATLQHIRGRLLSSGLPLRRVAQEAELAENTVAKVARASPRVTVDTLRRIERVLDRLASEPAESAPSASSDSVQ
jgi:transcriptional regulator with XRE-family HTH domain